MKAKVVGFISIKGGVGKTTLSYNVALSLAHDFNKKVLVVDANFSGPSLSLYFDISPKFYLQDVFDGKVGVNKAIAEDMSGVDVLPSTLRMGKFDFLKLRQYLSSVKFNYDVIIVDSSPSLNEETLSAITACDEIFVITTPDYVTLAATLYAVKVARMKMVFIAGLVLNNVRHKKYELDAREIEKLCGVPVVSVVEHDEEVIKSLQLGEMLAIKKPRRESVVEFKKLAGALVGEEYRAGGLMSRIKRLFGRKSQEDINRMVLMHSHYE